MPGPQSCHSRDEPHAAVQRSNSRADRVSVDIVADRRRDIAQLACRTAERFAELADVADLMGDHEGAARLRRRAADANERAMALLDE
jgi:hypothetical protein